MLKVNDERTITDPVIYSSDKSLGGQTVRILVIDEGEAWEESVIKILTSNGQKVWMNPKDLEPLPLYPVHDEIAQALGGFRFDADDLFGGLPVIAPEDCAEPGACSDDCYICRDQDFAARGLPLCRACPACGGHIAADDSVCDDCGLDDSDFWQLVAMVKEDGQELDSDLTIYTRRIFFTSDYKPKDPTVKELHRATKALKRELEQNKEETNE